MAMQIVPQGNLNRLRASIVLTSFPQLNVTSPYLGPEGIRLAFDSNAADLLPTMTGMVTSPAPYQAATLTMAIVKSTPLANLYKQQFEDVTMMGEVTVRPDSTTLDPFVLENMTLETVREMGFAGNDAVVVVTMRGYRLVNQGFF